LLASFESLLQLTPSAVVTIARAKPNVCRSIVSSFTNAGDALRREQQLDRATTRVSCAQCCVRKCAYHGTREIERVRALRVRLRFRNLFAPSAAEKTRVFHSGATHIADRASTETGSIRAEEPHF
jgi:hypothetical protein